MSTCVHGRAGASHLTLIPAKAQLEGGEAAMRRDGCSERLGYWRVHQRLTKPVRVRWRRHGGAYDHIKLRMTLNGARQATRSQIFGREGM